MWHAVWCGYKSKHQKDMCLKEIGQRAQDMIIVNGQHNWEDYMAT